MKKFLQNKKLLSVCIVVIALFTVIGGSVSLRNKRNTPLVIQSLGNDIVAVGARIVDFPIGIISGGFNNVNELLNTQNENNYLKSRVSELEQTKARNSCLEAENKQLKSALKLKKTLTDFDQVNASVISRSPDSWTDILVINKGTTSQLLISRLTVSPWKLKRLTGKRFMELSLLLEIRHWHLLKQLIARN